MHTHSKFEKSKKALEMDEGTWRIIESEKLGRRREHFEGPIGKGTEKNSKVFTE